MTFGTKIASNRLMLRSLRNLWIFVLISTFLISSSLPSEAEAFTIKPKDRSCAGLIREIALGGVLVLGVAVAIGLAAYFGPKRAEKIERAKLFADVNAPSMALQSVKVANDGGFELTFQVGKKLSVVSDSQGFFTAETLLYALSQQASENINLKFRTLEISLDSWTESLNAALDEPVRNWEDVFPLMMAALIKMKETLALTSGGQEQIAKIDRLIQIHNRILTGQRQAVHRDIAGQSESLGAMLAEVSGKVAFSYQVGGTTYSTSDPLAISAATGSAPPEGASKAAVKALRKGNPLGIYLDLYEPGSFPPRLDGQMRVLPPISVPDWKTVSEVK